MDLETLRNFCKKLPGATEDVKWENDLCFMVGNKMFCITGFGVPLRASMKVTDDDFEELVNRSDIIPAPYLARYKWVSIQDPSALTNKEWEHYVRKSYELVKAKLPKKVLKEHGLL